MIRSSKHAVNISIPTHTLHYPAMKWINSTKQFHHLSVRSLCQLEPSLCMASNQWSHPLNKTQQNSSIDQKVDHHWMVDFTLVTIQQAHTSTLKFLKKSYNRIDYKAQPWLWMKRVIRLLMWLRMFEFSCHQPLHDTVDASRRIVTDLFCWCTRIIISPKQ